MTLPDIIVWPWLLGGAALCALRNWRAGVLFAACVLGVKLIQYVGISPPQLHFFALYSFLGVAAYLGWDKHAGVVLCLVGIIYATHLFGLTTDDLKLLLTEIALFAGMLVCAYNDPSNGILARPADTNSHRHGFRGRWIVAGYPQIVPSDAGGDRS